MLPIHYEKRLLKLADFLDTLPPERFRYDRWVGDSWKGMQDLSCGTTACALGWAATMPAFRKLGLRLFEIEDGGKKTGFCALEGTPYNKYSSYSTLSSYSLDAAMEIFGLSRSEASFIFYPGSEYFLPEETIYSPGRDAPASEVAKHIRNFVTIRRNIRNKNKEQAVT